MASFFEILAWTPVKLALFTARVEKHGKEDVSAVTLRFAVLREAAFLDTITPGLRDMLFKAVDGQESLPNMERSTPLRRCPAAQHVKLNLSHEGWTLKVDRGIDPNDPMTITKCKVDGVTVQPRDGEMALVEFNVGSSDLSEAEGGWLFGHQRQLVPIMLTAPLVTDGAIDGTKGHPGANGGDLLDGDDGPQRDLVDGDGGDSDGKGDDAGPPPEAGTKPRKRRGPKTPEQALAESTPG